MVYYRVKKRWDNATRFRYIGSSNLRITIDGAFIGGELYTPAERSRLAAHDKVFDKVELSSRKTYWCFGARFSSEV